MRAIVVGAGPAGSLAAVLLTRGGVDVTVVEQFRFPRDKVCGECLSALGISVLRRHGLASSILNAGARLLDRAHLVAYDTRATLELPEPMFGISRRSMDAILLDAARDAGATVLQPARVDQIDDGRVRVRDGRMLHADVILRADGRATHESPRDLGIKAHFENVDADPCAISLYAVDGCYGGIAPVEQDRWNIAFSVPAMLVKARRGDMDLAFAELRASNRALDRALAGAERVSDWLASPLPRHLPDNDWPSRVIPVGNAAGAIEPIGGEGMGLALRSAELAVEAILANRLDGLPAQYRRLWWQRSLFCRLGAQIMSRRGVADIGIGLTQIIPARALTALVGK